MNSINLVGNICNDLELRMTQNGKSVLQFNIAVKRPFTKDVTDFFSAVAWDKQAEVLSKYSKKGDKVGLSGVLTSRKWEDSSGNKRTTIEVVANNVFLLETKKDSASASPSAIPDDFGGFTEVDADDGDLPF